MSNAASQPIVLTRSATHVYAGATEIAALGDAFRRDFVVRLPGFFAPDLLHLLWARLPTAAFSRRVDGGVEIEHTLEEPSLVGAVMVALNDPVLFAIVAAITGCGAIGCFSGRVQSRSHDPAGGHYFPWHTDAVQRRLVGISVNLGREPFQGGILQLRRRRSKRIVAEIANREPGDALLFRISRDLEHHVTPVDGGGTRTVLAGWFRRQPQFRQSERIG